MDRPQATPRVLRARPLSRNAFEPFGEVLDASGPYDDLANGDAAQIFRDRATLDVAELGVRARINIVRTAPTRLPLMLEMMERHPLSSQAFAPLSSAGWLIIAAPPGSLDRPRSSPSAWREVKGSTIGAASGTIRSSRSIGSAISLSSTARARDRISTSKSLPSPS